MFSAQHFVKWCCTALILLSCIPYSFTGSEANCKRSAASYNYLALFLKLNCLFRLYIPHADASILSMRTAWHCVSSVYIFRFHTTCRSTHSTVYLLVITLEKNSNISIEFCRGFFCKARSSYGSRSNQYRSQNLYVCCTARCPNMQRHSNCGIRCLVLAAPWLCARTRRHFFSIVAVG